MRACLQEIETWMYALGMTTHIDAVGNLHGLYRAQDGSTLPRLLIGSHLDTVPDAGAYDGVLGVVLAVSLIASLDGSRLPFAIEVVGFSEEEGVRFGVPFIGSRALTGTVDELLLGRCDSQAFLFVMRFARMVWTAKSAAPEEGILGYLEFHIKQGPVLENINLSLAAVEAIAGQTRMELIFR
jgi:allantoate deiminase